MIHGLIAESPPEGLARFGPTAGVQMKFPHISIIMRPVARKRPGFLGAGAACRAMLIEKPLPAQQGPFRGDAPGRIVAVEAVSVERLRKVDDGKSPIQSDRQVDILPDRELRVVASHRLKTGFPAGSQLSTLESQGHIETAAVFLLGGVLASLAGLAGYAC